MSKEYKIELIKQGIVNAKLDVNNEDFDEMLKDEDGFAQFIDIICDAMETYLDNKGVKPQEQRARKHFEDDGAYAD